MALRKQLLFRCPLLFVCIGIAVCVLALAYVQRPTVARYALLLGVPTEAVAVLYGTDASLQMQLGYHHFGGEGVFDLERARWRFEKALSIDPERLMVRFDLARIAFLQRRPHDALKLLSEEERLNPDLEKIYYQRGLIYGYDNRLVEAKEAFREFTKRRPTQWAGFVDLSWVLFRMGKYQEAKEVLEDIIPHHNNAWVKNAYGVVLLNLGDKVGARSALAEAKVLAERLTPEQWGNAYAGNDPYYYEQGLREMRRHIAENIDLAGS